VTKGGFVEKVKAWWADLDLADCKLDPYCQLTLVRGKDAPQKVKSKQLMNISDTVPAYFNDTLTYDYVMPGGEKPGQMFIEVWDEDPGADDLIGFAPYQLKNMFDDQGNVKSQPQMVDLFDGEKAYCGKIEMAFKAAGGKLTVEIIAAHELRNSVKAVTNVQQDKTLWYKAALCILLYFLLAILFYTNVERKDYLTGSPAPAADLDCVAGVPADLAAWSAAKAAAEAADVATKASASAQWTAAACPADKTANNAIAACNSTGSLYTTLHTAFAHSGGDEPTCAEPWTPTDAVYYSVVTLTTVGYGDLYPKTDTGKYFTCLFVYLGVGMVASMLSYAVSVLLCSSRSAVVVKEKMEKLARSESSGGVEPTPEEKEREANLASFRAILKAFLTALGMTLVGALFFCFYEEEKANYVDPEGKISAFTNAFYMAVITMTSVGYGDFSPQSQNGRIFAIFWIQLGTMSVVFFAGEISKWFLDRKARQLALRVVSKPVKFADIAKIGGADQEIDEMEYLEFMLVKTNKCSAEDIKELRVEFERISGGDGFIEASDLK
jgi:voltage-gated potassium channel Kch